MLLYEILVVYSQLEPGESRDVHIPIVFTRRGTIEVTVIGSTMMQKDSHSVSIDVQPEVGTQYCFPIFAPLVIICWYFMFVFIFFFNYIRLFFFFFFLVRQFTPFLSS